MNAQSTGKVHGSRGVYNKQKSQNCIVEGVQNKSIHFRVTRCQVKREDVAKIIP